MGIIVQVYRWSLGDATNNGVSSRHNSLCVTNVEGPFEPSDASPAAQLVQHRSIGEHCYIVPQSVLDSGKWYMMGGNFAHSSDSRFREAVEKITDCEGSFAIAIHDRVED